MDDDGARAVCKEEDRTLGLAVVKGSLLEEARRGSLQQVRQGADGDDGRLGRACVLVSWSPPSLLGPNSLTFVPIPT